MSMETSFSENTVRVSLKTDKIKSLFRELFIGLISMFSSQNYEITLICPNNMWNRFPIFVIIHRLETYHDDLTTHY